MITPVILAGGTGTRLWPMSRPAMPKQFLPLVGTVSTFQMTLERVADPALFAGPIVVTNEAHRDLAQAQIEAAGASASVLLEPCARDSAAAIAAATGLARQRDGSEAVILILAADHLVLDQDRFIDACLAGRRAAEAGRIVTFGIEPNAPKTGYGYIRPDGADAADVARVAAFVEKPDARTAARYIAAGYLWNSGNFMVRADILRDEFAALGRGVAGPVERALDRASADRGAIRLDPKAFEQAERISFDHCIMERTDRASVVRARFRWSDIGSWDAIWGMSDHDAKGNLVRGDAELVDCSGCLVHADHGVVGVIGADNLVVCVTPDAVLIADRDRADDVKTLVSHLNAAERPALAKSE